MTREAEVIQDDGYAFLLLSGEKQNNLNRARSAACRLIDLGLALKIPFQLRIFRQLHFNDRLVGGAASDFEISGSSAVIEFGAHV
jgi:hypothetical protein